MKRGLLVFFLTVLTCPSSYPNTNQPQANIFDPAPWLEDFHQVLSEMSSHYANLEWAVDDRKMDLPRLRLDTEAKLNAATTELDARRILDQFLASFGDGHLEIEWPKSGAQPTPAPTKAQSLCARMGYSNRNHPGLDFSLVPEFASLNTPETTLFPGGLLRLHNRVLGIIRIGLFSEHAYPEVCEQAVRDLHMEKNAECDAKCDDQIELATANLLTSALVRRANALAAAGATALLIDITHNGGGSDWVEAPPRALSSIPLRDAKMAFIKHEHWTKQLQERLRDVQTDLKQPTDSQTLLRDAADKLEKAIGASKQTCQRAAVWDTGKLPCSLLVKEPLFASGIMASAKPGSLAALSSKEALFQPSRYTYFENPRQLPLYVLVDRGTWSAAEYFAALLQDNHAAIVIGELTGGAGCGYTDGGIPAELKNSGAQLKMPDCVRFRADGSNEVNGITPDILLPWSGHDSDFQRVSKLLAALESQKASNLKPPLH